MVYKPARGFKQEAYMSSRLTDLLMFALALGLLAAGYQSAKPVVNQITQTLQQFSQADW